MAQQRIINAPQSRSISQIMFGYAESLDYLRSTVNMLPEMESGGAKTFRGVKTAVEEERKVANPTRLVLGSYQIIELDDATRLL